MTSLPLEVHHVLEEEYVSMYGPLDRPPVTYDASQILDRADARRILRACGSEVAAHGVEAKLNELLEKDEKPEALKESPVLTECGRLLLRKYDAYRKGRSAWEAMELRRRIIDDAFNGAVKPLRDIRLANVYTHLHAQAKDAKEPRPRTALCVSGGGIRSATFALGIIQGLASVGLLKRFHYLSTVSGGGYIGSWLSSWVRRHPKGVQGVEDELHRADTAVASIVEADHPKKREIPEAKVDPEPTPVRHLRDYSNYLSPRLGLLSADSWTIASLYIRNLSLNLLVLIPLIAFAMAIPRFFSWGLMRNEGLDPLAHPWVIAISVIIAFATIGLARPVERGVMGKPSKLSSKTAYLIGVVLPLYVAACSLAMFWAHWAHASEKGTAGLFVWDNLKGPVIALLAGLILVPVATYYMRIWFIAEDARMSGIVSTKAQSKYLWSKFFYELIAVTIAGATAAGLFVLLATKVFPHPRLATPDVALMSPWDRLLADATPESQLYVCFAVPAALLVFFVQASIFVGLSSRRNEDSDREWWGRGGALSLMAAFGTAAFAFISVFGPVALYHFPAIIGSIGGLAGVMAAVLGFSDKTPANQSEKEQAGPMAMVGNLASALVVPLFVVFLLALISLASTWLIHETAAKRPFEPSEWTQKAATTAHRTDITATRTGNTVTETREDLPSAPLASFPDLRSYYHLQTVHNTTGEQLLWFIGIAIVAVSLSCFIGVNKFSMHAFYRNRLIRAYLGASRTRRAADPFTGFDENDNLQMWELRPELLSKGNIRDEFVAELLNPQGGEERNRVAKLLWGRIDAKTRALLQDQCDDVALEALVRDLNHLLMTEDWSPVDEAREAKQILHSRPHRNRALLDKHFAGLIEPMRVGCEQRGPLHVVNTALNLTSGGNLGWQQRKAESFTVSPFHCGSLYVGYRPSRHYGGAQGISLGTAVTTSGAAASPNMGYHSSPAMAFLLTIFNVRLGSWLGNPGLFGQTSYYSAHPWSNLRPLIHELTGGSTDQSKWIYLSDGGHFENLGLYEMVLRRCHFIVLSDAGADPKATFEDLGNAIRKIRTDLGVAIDVDDAPMRGRGPDGSFPEGSYVARATIRYSAVDEGGYDGTLIYIKTGVYSNDHKLPRDVYNYAQQSQSFPHESTADQFFSESQFESYRALGRHVINDIAASYVASTPDARLPILKRYADLSSFDTQVQLHLRPPAPPAKAPTAEA